MELFGVFVFTAFFSFLILNYILRKYIHKTVKIAGVKKDKPKVLTEKPSAEAIFESGRVKSLGHEKAEGGLKKEYWEKLEGGQLNKKNSVLDAIDGKKEIAKEKFRRGDLDEESFKKIMYEYEKESIETESKLKKH